MKQLLKCSVLAVIIGVTSASADTVVVSNNFDGVLDAGETGFVLFNGGSLTNNLTDPSIGLLSFLDSGASSWAPGFVSDAAAFDVSEYAGITITWTIASTVPEPDPDYNGWFLGVQTVNNKTWNNSASTSFGINLKGSSGPLENGTQVVSATGGKRATLDKVGNSTDASMSDGFTATITLNRDDTYTVSTTGLSTELNASGEAPGFFAAIAPNLFVSTFYQVNKNKADNTQEGFTIDSVSLVAIPITDTVFTDGSSDGTWTNAANWDHGLPSVTNSANVNSNLTANLSGGAGTTMDLLVGTHDDQSGTVTNGSLTISGSTLIGTGSNAVGTVSSTTYTAVSNGVVGVATGRDSTGSLTAVSGSIIASELSLATGSNSVGTLSIAAGTVTVAGAVNIATSRDAEANVSLGSGIVLASTNDLFVGTGISSSHNLTASDFSIAGPIGSFGVRPETGPSIIGLFNSYDTMGDIFVNTNFAFTAFDHEITRLSIASQDDVSASFGVSGAATASFSGRIDVAGGKNSSASMNLGEWLSGPVTGAVINVARNEGAVGSLTYTNDNMYLATNSLSVAGAAGASGTVLLKSVTGAQSINIGNSDATSASTGTVTVLQDVDTETVSIGNGDNGNGTLSVGGTLNVSLYFNIAKDGVDSVGQVFADTINKTGVGSIHIARAEGSYGVVTADSGTIHVAGNNGIKVASALNSYGVFAVTNGIVSLTEQQLSVAAGNNSTGSVLVATLNKSSNNDIKIGIGSNAYGIVEITDGGVIGANTVTLGSSNSVGVLLMTDVQLTVGTSNLTINTGSYIDATGLSGSLIWTDKVEADYIGLWNAGQLRSNGESGLTAATFSDYFAVSGNTLNSLSATGSTDVMVSGPVAITGGEGMILTWDSELGKTYNVTFRDSLTIGDWEVYTNFFGGNLSIVGDGGSMSVTTKVEEVVEFYKVVN